MNWLLLGIGIFLGFVAVLIIVLLLGKKYRKHPAEEKKEDNKSPKSAETIEKAEQDKEKKQPKQKAKKVNSMSEKKPQIQQKKESENNAEEGNQTYRIVYDKEQKDWIVRIDGGKRASRRCKTKAEALEVAKELAKKKDADLSVHKKNGRFQKQK